MIMNSLLKNVENYENSLGIPPKMKNLMNLSSSVFAPARKIQFKVFEELTNPINSNNELKFEFDFNFENYQTISDLFLLSENITLFSRAELYISNILKSSFSIEAYQLFNGLTKEKEINIFNMFSRGNLPLPLRVKEFKVRILIYFKNIEPDLRCYFKFNANLLAPEQIQKFYSDSLQYNIYTYYEKSFSLRDEMIYIPIEYNNPISFIGVIFDNNIESINVQIDSLKLIPNHLTTNKLHNSFGPDYEINNNIFIDLNDNWFYPWESNIILENKSKTTYTGKIVIQTPNCFRANTKLMFSMAKLNKNIIPSNPLTKFSDDEYVEGYWIQKEYMENKTIKYGFDPFIDKIYPFPKQQSKDKQDFEFIIKLKSILPDCKVIAFNGESPCRLANKTIGNKEYSFIYNGITYRFPEGYIVYLQEFNIQPSQEFKDAVNGVYMNKLVKT